MKKVVVTKGIFPPQPFRHSRDNSRRNKKKKKKHLRKTLFFQTVSNTSDPNVGQRQDLPRFWEMHKYGFPFQRKQKHDREWWSWFGAWMSSWFSEREVVTSACSAGPLSSIQVNPTPFPIPLPNPPPTPPHPSPTVNDYKYLFGDVVL